MNTTSYSFNDGGVNVMETHTGKPNTSHSRLAGLRLVAAVVLGIGLLPVLANAQSTWTGATDTNWGAAGNWSPAGVPADSTALTFGIATNYVVDLGGVTRTVGTTTFTNDYTLNNGTLSLGAFTLSTGTNSTTTINANINSTSTASTLGGSGNTVVNGLLSGTRFTIASGSTVKMGGVTTNTHLRTFISGSVIVDKPNFTAQRAALGSSLVSFTGAGAVLIFTNVLGSMTPTLDVLNSGTIIGHAGLYFDGNVQFGQNVKLSLYAPTGDIRFYNYFIQRASHTGSVELATLSDVQFNQVDRGLWDAPTYQIQLIKSGAGTLIYANTVSNRYSGWTRIDDGVLSLTKVEQLGTSSDAAANLVLNGGTLRYAGTNANATSTRGFTVNTGTTSWIDVTNAASTLVFTGTHTGTGNLVKRGPGTLELTGDGSGRGGSTIVSNGVLRLASGGTLGSALQVVSGARFDVSNGTSVVGGAVDSAGLISVVNSKVTWQSAVNLSGGYVSDPSTNTFSADLTITPSGWLAGGAGDLFDFKKSLLIHSTNNSVFDLVQSTVQFSGGGTHTNQITGFDGGTNRIFGGNFEYGTLRLGSSADVVCFACGNIPTNSNNGMYVGWLDLLGDTNLVANLRAPANINLYYQVLDPRNSYLNGATYQLLDCDGAPGGFLMAAVPEPSAMLLIGAGAVLLVRRKPKRS